MSLTHDTFSKKEEENPLRLWIVGMMACGKSSVNRILSNKLDSTGVDMDTLMVRRQGKSIREIFEAVQEEGFRLIEKAAVHELSTKKESMVISTGGWAPCFHANMNAMNESGITVFLDGSPELLAKRTMKDEEDSEKPVRPLVHGLPQEKRIEKFGTMLETRRPFYEQAQLRVIIDDKPLETIIEEILVWIRR